MDAHFNFLILPIFIPFILAGKAFLDHSDFGMAVNELVRKRTILFTILALIAVIIIQIILQHKLF